MSLTDLTRAELFEQVWRQPLSKVAVDLGVSATGLAKICDRTAIPYPTRGHWAKARAGRMPASPTLPPAPEGVDERIVITPGSSTVRRPRVRMGRDDRRAHLLDVAARVIVADGLYALTMKRLAREAGITAPRAYHFFPSVGDLLIELTRRELQAVREVRQKLIDTSERPAERLRLSTVAYLRQVAERGVLLQTLQASPVVRRGLRREQREIRAGNTQVVADRFTRSHGAPPDMASATTTVLTSTVLRAGRLMARRRLTLDMAEPLAADIVEAGNRRLAARFQTPPARDVEDA